MISVSVFEFRDKLATYLDLVKDTESSIVVRRFGKPIAILSPYTKDVPVDFRSFFGLLKGKETGEEVLAKLRRSAAEGRRVRSLRSKGV